MRRKDPGGPIAGEKLSLGSRSHDPELLPPFERTQWHFPVILTKRQVQTALFFFRTVFSSGGICISVLFCRSRKCRPE